MKLINKIIFLGALFSFYANAAQVNITPHALVSAALGAVGVPAVAAIPAIIGGAYTFDNAHIAAPVAATPQKWHRFHGGVVGVAHILTARDLRSHLNDVLTGAAPAPAPVVGVGGVAIPPPNGNVDCVRELARMLLAQVSYVLPVGNVDHNVATNNGPNYVIAGLQATIAGGAQVPVPGRSNFDDIFKSSNRPKGLVDHLLNHGHLGYFPMFSHADHDGVSNSLISRGVFNIDIGIMNRINLSQKQIYDDFIRFMIGNKGSFSAYPHENYPLNRTINNNYLHMLSNIIYGSKFKVDPAVSLGKTPNLEEATYGLINNLLSTSHISGVVLGTVKLNGNQNEKNRFALDVTYNFPSAIPNVMQTQDVGYNLTGGITNTVKIVIQVLNGFVSVVTMYPI